MREFRFGLAAAVVAVFGLSHFAGPARADLTADEVKCSATLSKSFSKYQSTILKTKLKCHVNDISGKTNDPNDCTPLSGKDLDKVNKAKTKLISKVAKSCHGECSTTDDIDCIWSMACPAKHPGNPEVCTGFNLRHLGWPGPYCDSILGHGFSTTEDLGTCVAALADTTSHAVETALFADLNGASNLGDTAAKCLSKVAKGANKAIAKAYSAAAGCRNDRQTDPDPDQVFRCGYDDSKVSDVLAGELEKLSGSIGKSCGDADIAALTGLCAAGATPTTVAQAQACISDMVREMAVSEPGFSRHVYGPITMLNVTHPDSAEVYCGDGIVNATREERTGVGEECDGDDTPCGAGSCLPPGDVFECTCDTTPRERFSVNGDTSRTDSDAGWTGDSHEATHNDGFGYVTSLSNCDCDAITGASCTGTSSSPVCTVHGNMAPRCSNDLDGPLTCDQHGNNGGQSSDDDCFACDSYSINAGTYCADSQEPDESVCSSQCIVDSTDLAVVPQTPCQTQSDCGEGETCRGRCDNTVTCNSMTEGSPLGLVSAATSVCIRLEYKTDVTGTKNIVTGSQAVDYSTRSIIRLGELYVKPCPQCGGVCIGGSNDGDPCFGRCDVSNTDCLVDSDCAGNAECLESAADCTGGTCSLDLRCSAGESQGRLCQPDSETPLGIVSRDCQPTIGINLSGQGVQQPFGNVTTGEVHFPAGGPCTANGYQNFNCPCNADAVGITGQPSKPNACAAACDGGVNEGLGCVTGDGGGGVFTKCEGGAEDGIACDDNADCDSPGTCTDNPKHCVDGAAGTLGFGCSSNAECGTNGDCEDACPGAHCVPLCYPEGNCDGGARDGDVCATNVDCRECIAGLTGRPCRKDSDCDTSNGSGNGDCELGGGVDCLLSDAEDGVCAGGPEKLFCNGPGFTTLPCTVTFGVEHGCESGNNGLLGDADDIPGSGGCEPRPLACFWNNGSATGGGDATNVDVNAAFCTPPSGVSAIDPVSGFGGPSRIRRQGSAIVNVPSIP